MRVRAVLAALLSLAALVSMVVGAAVLVAPAARAASAPSTDGGALRSGVGVTGTVPTGGATETFTWPAVAGQHVTFDIAGGSWKNAGGTAAGDLTVYDANGSYVGQRQVGTSSTWLEIVPASTGTYTAVVSGYGASTGSMSFTWAPDLYSSLSSTATTTSTIAFRGRHEVYSWSAVAGQHVTFDIGATSWKNTTGATASGSLTVYDPAGGYVGQQNVAAAASYLDLVPSSTGTYTAVVSGYSGSTGSMTLTFARDVTGTLSNGTAVTAKVAYRGRHDVYTWSAAAGQHVTFDVSAASWQDTMSSTAAGYLTV